LCYLLTNRDGDCLTSRVSPAPAASWLGPYFLTHGRHHQLEVGGRSWR